MPSRVAVFEHFESCIYVCLAQPTKLRILMVHHFSISTLTLIWSAYQTEKKLNKSGVVALVANENDLSCAAAACDMHRDWPWRARSAPDLAGTRRFYTPFKFANRSGGKWDLCAFQKWKFFSSSHFDTCLIVFWWNNNTNRAINPAQHDIVVPWMHSHVYRAVLCLPKKHRRDPSNHHKRPSQTQSKLRRILSHFELSFSKSHTRPE